MKKVISFLVALVMVVGLAACGIQATPSSQVDKELNDIKTKGTEAVNEALDLGDTELSSEEYKAFVTKLQDFDYEIIEEKVDGDKATVKVKITTYDFGTALEDAYTQMLTIAFSGEDISDEQIESILFGELAKPEEKTFEKEVIINCTKDGDEWTTDIDSNEDLTDAVFGGLITREAEIEEAFASME